MTRPTFTEPRWPALVAMIAAGLVYLALPEHISLGPRWLLLTVMIVLLVPILVSHRRGDYKVTRFLTLSGNVLITLAMIGSLGFLVEGMPAHRESPYALLRATAALWLTNVLVFALWYWKLDGGGPLGRERAGVKFKSGFLFPQMLEREALREPWSPQFVDYLFLAFNTSTAFSPTDTAALSRWAKIGMMLQSLVSLSIIVLLAARAISLL
jgi:hypothetical protein